MTVVPGRPGRSGLPRLAKSGRRETERDDRVANRNQIIVGQLLSRDSLAPLTRVPFVLCRSSIPKSPATLLIFA